MSLSLSAGLHNQYSYPPVRRSARPPVSALSHSLSLSLRYAGSICACFSAFACIDRGYPRPIMYSVRDSVSDKYKSGAWSGSRDRSPRVSHFPRVGRLSREIRDERRGIRVETRRLRLTTRTVGSQLRNVLYKFRVPRRGISTTNELLTFFPSFPPSSLLPAAVLPYLLRVLRAHTPHCH